jgi:hypothetical protein
MSAPKHTPEQCPTCAAMDLSPISVELTGLNFSCDRQHSVSAPAEYYPVYSAAPQMLEAFELLAKNMENDIFVEPVKRAMYMGIIKTAIAVAKGGKQ